LIFVYLLPTNQAEAFIAQFLNVPILDAVLLMKGSEKHS